MGAAIITPILLTVQGACITAVLRLGSAFTVAVADMAAEATTVEIVAVTEVDTAAGTVAATVVTVAMADIMAVVMVITNSGHILF
tara:strand:- start:314 stop:568 length:255 start_codon:yes stop_codon:yes gene_type:complete